MTRVAMSVEPSYDAPRNRRESSFGPVRPQTPLQRAARGDMSNRGAKAGEDGEVLDTPD
jgi:hypothetical protein